MKKSIIIFCDNDLSHNIPLIGIGNLLKAKGHFLIFCGSSKNELFYKNRVFEYVSLDIFNNADSTIKNGVDLGFYQLNTLNSIMDGNLDSLMESKKPNMILLPYYISYLLPFLKKRYNTIGYCCVNILLRGELFTPEYLYYFHYNSFRDCSRKKINEMLELNETDHRTQITSYYRNFKEIILCPKELDFSNKFKRQNVEYSEAIVANVPDYSKTLDKKNLVLFSMGTNCKVYPLVTNMLVKKLLEVWKLIKIYDKYFKIILSIPDGILNPDLEQLCKREEMDIVSWFDQNKLLYQAKVMITHGGIGAFKECVYSQTPMLCFPFTRDQPYNANRIENLGLGRTMHPLNSEVKEIYNVLIDLIENEKYKSCLEEFRTIFHAYRKKNTLYNQLMKIAN